MNELFREAVWQELRKGGNLTRLCNIGEEFLRNPVAITLTTLTVVAKSKGYRKDLLQEYINLGKNVPMHQAQDLFASFDKDFEKGIPITRPLPFMQYLHTACGCLHNGTLIAVLDIPQINEVDPDEVSGDVCILADAMAIALVMNGVVGRDYYLPMQHYIADIINGSFGESRYQNPYLIRSILSQIDLLRMIWIIPGNEEKGSFRSTILEICKKEKNAWMVSYYRGGFIIVYDDSVSGLLNNICKASDSAQIYVSDAFETLDQVHTEIKMCLFAKKMTSAYLRLSYPVYVQEYRSLYTALIPYHNGDIDLYANDLFEKLSAYDKKYHTLYLDTLRAYFVCKQDPAEMAVILNIHKNTVFYRLGKIRELFDIDFKDIQQMMSLFLSILINDQIV